MTRFVLDDPSRSPGLLTFPVPSYALEVRQAIANDVALSLSHLEQLLAQYIESSSDFISLKQALPTARVFHVSAYDGVYLETARREGAALATLDKNLRSAAGRAGVPIFQ